MTTWGVTAGCLLLVAGLSACRSDEASAPGTTSTRRATTTTTAPERPASTTTTAYAPDSIEGEVEAAYLRSWEVYAAAVYDLELNEAALAEVFADPLLSVRSREISDRIKGGRASLVRVVHNYRVEMTGSDTAALVDTYRNHQVLIDVTTKAPREPDPDETIVDAFTLSRMDGRWRVFDQRRLT